MGNPFEYREMMRAQMRFGEERTPQEVSADQKARHADRSAGRRRRGPKMAADGPPQHGVVRQSEVDKVRAMLGQRAPEPATN